MMKKQIINRYFRGPELQKYNFSKSNIVYIRKLESTLSSPKKYNNWRFYQLVYLFWNWWSKAATSFNQKSVKEFDKNIMIALRALFTEIGFLRGDVLDLGGGCGSFAEFWQHKSDCRYFNHDPNVKSYEYCLKKDDDRIIFVEGLAENLPYNNQVFETILMADSFEHFSEPDKTLKESFRVLKKEGNILMIHSLRSRDFARNSLLKKLYLLFTRYVHNKIHTQNLEEKDIIKLLKENGFLKIESFKKRVRHSPVDLLIIMATKAL